jgi:hypothetical protein
MQAGPFSNDQGPNWRLLLEDSVAAADAYPCSNAITHGNITCSSQRNTWARCCYHSGRVRSYVNSLSFLNAFWRLHWFMYKVSYRSIT